MSKRLVLLFGALLLSGLAACQSSTPTLEPTPTLVAVAPTPEPTDTPSVAKPSATPEDTPAPTPVSAGDKPAPTPTTPWRIPEIQKDDNIRGGAGAGLTIVEYSDFQ